MNTSKRSTISTQTGYDTDIQQSPESGWLSFANFAIFIRATMIAIVIGIILTLINQSGWVAGRESLQPLQLVLVFLIPFAVVAIAQIAGVRQAYLDSVVGEASARHEKFITTARSHGIPARAVAIGLFFGSLNAAIVLAFAYLRSGDISAVSIVPLGQAFVLPLLFGLLSQTISYRRSRDLIAT